eukprot:11031763-Ditylum_brightwellii.AAC.1
MDAPNELLTNNSKVQAGQQFTDINHKNMTEHYYPMPHCQNQNVNTVDISVLCYTLWEPIKYLDPSCQFPEFKWQNGYCVGIVWDHGNPLTYLLWTEPDGGGWQKGTEPKNSDLFSKAERAKLNKKQPCIGTDSTKKEAPSSKHWRHQSAPLKADGSHVDKTSDTTNDPSPIFDESPPPFMSSEEHEG